jgi:hypothetical protein
LESPVGIACPEYLVSVLADEDNLTRNSVHDLSDSVRQSRWLRPIAKFPALGRTARLIKGRGIVGAQDRGD